jgi:molecular chaperone IbpA
MQTLDFSPFLRSTVGFDRIFNSLDNINAQEAKAYPPYNIERVDDDVWHVSVAVAGFSIDDIAIETKENNLSIKGAKETLSEVVERDFLHRGIAERNFELRFQLGEYVEVSNAKLENGLLNIELKREVPESKKTRIININDGAKGKKKKIEGKSVN